MNLDLKYLGSSGLIESASGSSALSFQPNLARPKVFFDQRMKNPLRFREAMSALHDVVVGDLRFKRRDKSLYDAWKAEQTKQENELRASIVDHEKRKEIERIKGEAPPPNLEHDFRKMHSLYWNARRQWANELARSDPEMFRALVPCDPVVTVAPDTVFFECFAKDESSYGCLFVDRDAFEGSASSGLGTTNVDYSIALYEHFQTLRTYRETRLLVDPTGFEVKVESAGGYREEKIDLPPSWLKGFGQLSAAMALPSREVELSIDAVYSVLAHLKRHREKVGPRSIEFQLTPGKAPVMVLQPWGVKVESHGKAFVGEKPETIKVWGRRRLGVLARLLPIAERVTVQLLGSGLPSIWTAHLGDMRFVLGLSGWTTNDWTSGSNLELLSGAFVADLRASARILEHLKKQHVAGFDELSRLVEIARPSLIGSLHHLAQQGQVIFDFATKQYRFREVMPVALSESVLGPPSPELTFGIDAYRRGGVSLDRREVLPNLRQLLIAQVRTEGSRVGTRCEALFDSDGGYSKATCGCDYFRHFRLKKGPCRHLIALKLFENAEILSPDSAKKELLH
ncbi:MAG: SWIM zinc finger family protein [Archangium sp.]|nr:SWIM zinc finger family protein [Archangium sp.]